MTPLDVHKLEAEPHGLVSCWPLVFMRELQRSKQVQGRKPERFHHCKALLVCKLRSCNVFTQLWLGTR